jgi:hypothetical protein
MDGDEGPPPKPPNAVAPLGVVVIGGVEQQHDHDGSQPAPSLPDDVLADIFSRLAPRWVATCRRVCPSWRASIDARRILRADLLPLALRGIFLHFEVHKFPAFLARPAPPGAPKLSGKLSFLPFADPAACVWRPGEGYLVREKYAIKDHCNGLLLIDKHVVNPATRRWDALPPAPPGRIQCYISTDQDLGDATPIPETISTYLVFDPTVSAHYQVLRICALSRMGSMEDLSEDGSECPASSCTLNVLSSATCCWEERRFVREGPAAGTVAEVQDRPRSGAVYWRGALYVHCESHFVLRCVHYLLLLIYSFQCVYLTILTAFPSGSVKGISNTFSIEFAEYPCLAIHIV